MYENISCAKFAQDQDTLIEQSVSHTKIFKIRIMIPHIIRICSNTRQMLAASWGEPERHASMQ